MSGDDAILRVEDLRVGFGDRIVLDGISFSVQAGEIFVVMGPSGCGKTTLIKTLVGLMTARSGRILFEGAPLDDAGSFERFRRRIGMVFQHGALLNSMSLEENVALPLEEHTRLPEWMVRQVVRMKLAQVGLLEALPLLPMELSGGMRKRAGIARALVTEPGLLFFDEPTGGLDPMTADGIDNLVLELRAELNVTMLIVTHELASIFKIADRILMLRDGRIAVLGSRDAVAGSSEPGVADFIGRRAPEESGAADEFLAEVGAPPRPGPPAGTEPEEKA